MDIVGQVKYYSYISLIIPSRMIVVTGLYLQLQQCPDTIIHCKVIEKYDLRFTD